MSLDSTKLSDNKLLNLYGKSTHGRRYGKNLINSKHSRKHRAKCERQRLRYNSSFTIVWSGVLFSALALQSENSSLLGKQFEQCELGHGREMSLCLLCLAFLMVLQVKCVNFSCAIPWLRAKNLRRQKHNAESKNTDNRSQPRTSLIIWSVKIPRGETAEVHTLAWWLSWSCFLVFGQNSSIGAVGGRMIIKWWTALLYDLRNKVWSQ